MNVFKKLIRAFNLSILILTLSVGTIVMAACDNTASNTTPTWSVQGEALDVFVISLQKTETGDIWHKAARYHCEFTTSAQTKWTASFSLRFNTQNGPVETNIGTITVTGYAGEWVPININRYITNDIRYKDLLYGETIYVPENIISVIITDVYITQWDHSEQT